MASSFSPSFEKWENPLTKFIDRSSHEHFRASVLESLCCKSNVPQITKKIRATTTNQAQETKTRRHLPSDSYQLVAVQNSSKNRRDVDVYLPSWNTNTNVHIFRYKFTMDQVGLRTYSWLNNIVPKKNVLGPKKKGPGFGQKILPGYLYLLSEVLMKLGHITVIGVCPHPSFCCLLNRN